MEDKRFRYYDIKNPPLLLQGFEPQGVSSFANPEDRKQFQLEVNRGVVYAVDYVTANLATIAAPFDELNWADATVDLLAGGQELLRNAPLERFIYNADIGNQKEQRVFTWINGGQVLDSIMRIDPATISTVPVLGGQLHCYYTTQALEDWRKQFRWKNGQGLKRRAYKVDLPLVLGTFDYTVRDVLPKNQGKIIGFSIMHLGADISECFSSVRIDGIEIIKNVQNFRFSRFQQREPVVFKIPLNPGSTFEFIVRKESVTGNDGAAFITFYFDN